MPDTTTPAAGPISSVPSQAQAVPSASKKAIIGRVMIALSRALDGIEAELGHVVTAARTDLANIDHEAATVWTGIEAWFKKHF